MSGWQPDNRPRHAVGQRPAVPPQFGQDAPPRQDGTRSTAQYGQPPAPPQPYPQPRFEAAQPQSYRPAPAYQPPAAQPQPQARRMPAVGRPPYPWHLTRFPWKAMPVSRRRRGPSLGRMFYLGRHPIALLIQACILMIAFEVIAAWVALVALFWATQVACVTIAWLLACLQARTRA